ncbi:MAG TPA: hypothetical protein VMS77_07720 [Conexivisphaerales archaeon]|nr:hypothetical protein [Conexivisphaerales archaeon]
MDRRALHLSKASASLLAVSFLIVASATALPFFAACGLSPGEWHVYITLSKPVYLPGEPINLSGSITPVMQARLQLVFIMPDGSFNTYYVDTDALGNFTFSRVFITGEFSVFATFVNPSPPGNATTDMVNFMVQANPITTQQTTGTTQTSTQSSTVPSTSSSSSSTTTDNSSSQSATSITQQGTSSGGNETTWEVLLLVGVVAVAGVVALIARLHAHR